MAATACLVPYPLDAAAALARHLHWRMIMKLQCVVGVAAFPLSVASAACTRQPLSVSALARLCTPIRSSVRSWLLRLHPSFVLAPSQLPAPPPVLSMSTAVRGGTLWPLPAWVWRTVRLIVCFQERPAQPRTSSVHRATQVSVWCYKRQRRASARIGMSCALVQVRLGCRGSFECSVAQSGSPRAYGAPALVPVLKHPRKRTTTRACPRPGHDEQLHSRSAWFDGVGW